jgi:uncharacterized protein (DUF1501 family)
VPSSPSDDKALVCVFLLGGNDGHDQWVPLSAAACANELAPRGSVSLPDGNTPVLPILAKNGPPYALNGGPGGAASARGPG